MTSVGEWILSDKPVEINAGRRTVRMKVKNTGDRPIQIGSHFHFFEVNRAMDFDRPRALGMHLNVPAATAIRFEPGDEKEIELVEYGGMQRVIGFNNLVNGSVQAKWPLKEALERARDLEFGGMQHLSDDNEMAEVIGLRTKERQGVHVSERHPGAKGDQAEQGNQPNPSRGSHQGNQSKQDKQGSQGKERSR